MTGMIGLETRKLVPCTRGEPEQAHGRRHATVSLHDAFVTVSWAAAPAASDQLIDFFSDFYITLTSLAGIDTMWSDGPLLSSSRHADTER
jgi:hypothetical protein